MGEKVFEKADLTIVFDEDFETARPIGTFTSIRREGQGDLFADARQTHEVRAVTRVMFCEKMHFAVVEQRVTASDFGLSVLPVDHPYRDQSLPKLLLLRGAMCFNSADLTREVVRIADEWRAEMVKHVPQGVIDTRKEDRAAEYRREQAHNAAFDSVLDDAASQVNAGALNTNGVKVTATVTKRGRK